MLRWSLTIQKTHASHQQIEDLSASSPSPSSKLPQRRLFPTQPSSDVGVRNVNRQHLNPPRPRSVIEVHHSRSLLSPQPQHQDSASTWFDTETRRYTILRQFWHAWRAKSIRRRTRSLSFLDIADKHYRTIILPITFETWKQKWRYFAILRRRVERDRRRVILDRCLHWWRYTVRVAKAQNKRVRDELLLRRIFKTWLRHARVRKEYSDTLTLSSVMDRWKAKASSHRHLYRTAEHWNRQKVLRRAWKDWFFRTCSVKTVQYYELKLRQRSLSHWVLRIRRLREINRRVEIILRRKVASSALRKWRSALHNIINQNAQAGLLRQHKLLAETLRTWQRNLHISLRAGLLADKIGNEILRRAFERWKVTTYIITNHLRLLYRKLTIEAGTQANWNLLKTSFKAWRNDTVAARCQTRINRRLLYNTLSFWMIKHRGALLVRVHDQRFIQEAFRIWRERLDEIRVTLDSALETAQRSRTLRITRSSFEIWRERLAVLFQMHNLATVSLHPKFSDYQMSDQRALSRKSLISWKETLENNRQRGREADHALDYFLARRFLMKWHQRLKATRKRRRERLLEEHLRQIGLQSLARCLDRWRLRYADYVVQELKASEIREERDLSLVQDAFKQWRYTELSLRERRNRAEEFFNCRILRYHV